MTTQVPFSCICATNKRVNINPFGRIPSCHFCGQQLKPCDPPPASPGYEYFDFTYTSCKAGQVISILPYESYHWDDALRIKPNAIYEYAAKMKWGEWKPYLMANGMWDHPIRIGVDGYLTHGFCRLMACYVSGVDLTAATYAPEWWREAWKDDGSGADQE